MAIEYNETTLWIVSVVRENVPMSSPKPINGLPSEVILQLFPLQGEWNDGDYFALPGNRLVELVQGRVEVLPMPSLLHQFLARLMFIWMNEFVESNELGLVMSAPTRVRISQRHPLDPRTQ